MQHVTATHLAVKGIITATPQDVSVLEKVQLTCSISERKRPKFLYFVFANSTWETILNNRDNIEASFT